METPKRQLLLDALLNSEEGPSKGLSNSDMLRATGWQSTKLLSYGLSQLKAVLKKKGQTLVRKNGLVRIMGLEDTPKNAPKELSGSKKRASKEEMAELVRKILELLAKEPGKTTREITENFNLKPNSFYTILARHLRHSVMNRGRRYFLKKATKDLLKKATDEGSQLNSDSVIAALPEIIVTRNAVQPLSTCDREELIQMLKRMSYLHACVTNLLQSAEKADQLSKAFNF